VGDRRSTGLLLAMAGIALRPRSYSALLPPRGIVHFNRADLYLHHGQYYHKGPRARRHLRLFRSREQELELHYSSCARFRDSHCFDCALGFRARATTRIVGQAFPPAALWGSATGNGCPTMQISTTPAIVLNIVEQACQLTFFLFRDAW
jgi:hypothetical protein